MNTLVKKINDRYQDLFNNDSEHVFFKSRKWFNYTYKLWKTKNIYLKYNKKDFSYKPNINLDNIKSLNKTCKHEPYKIITKKKIERIIKKIEFGNNFLDMKIELSKMYNYCLPSNIKNTNIFLKKIKEQNKDSNSLNIIICGAGPVGLFTACHLYNYYHTSPLYKNIKVTILVIENRILREGIKYPYSRVTKFNYDVQLIQGFSLLNKIFCWENTNLYSNKFAFEKVNTLENLLYLQILKYNIPIMFTKKYDTFQKVKDFAIKHNYNYIFDSTGGRLQVPNKNFSLKWDKFIMKKGNLHVKLDKKDNYYKLYIDGKIPKTKKEIVFVPKIYDSQMKELFLGNMFGNMFGITSYKKDKELILKYNNKCFTLQDYYKISRKFREENIRKIVPRIIQDGEFSLHKTKYIKFTHFYAVSRHANRCAKVIEKKHKLIYIGIGETLGTSEYGIFFGMNHNMHLSKYICNLIGTYHFNKTKTLQKSKVSCTIK